MVDSITYIMSPQACVKSMQNFIAMQPSRKNEHTVSRKASCARMETVSPRVRAESCLAVTQWKSALTPPLPATKSQP